MGSFFRRLLDLDDDEIAARVFGDDVRPGEMTLLPAIRLFDEFAVRIVNVDGHFRGFNFGPKPKPIFVSLEELLAHRLFLPYAEITAPIILAHLEPVFHIRLGSLERERLRVVHRSARGRSERKNARERKTQAAEYVERRGHQSARISW